MSNYYDDMLSMLLGSGAFGPNQQATARTMASESEDERLRGLLGSKRKLGKREQMPSGAYALAEYPELRNAVDWARTGNLPGGSATIQLWLKEQNDPQLRAENMNKRKQWAARQGQLMGWW